MPGCFNPRPHAEGDSQELIVFTRWHVSIHALTRRATARVRSTAVLPLVSIHALTRRATLQKSAKCTNTKFQSTPSRGGRQAVSKDKQFELKFQSTPSRGGRPTTTSKITVTYMFQSTPSRGGRHSREYLTFEVEVSIHALTRRATQ